MSYLLVLAIVGALVLVHELGHFLVAKMVGLPVARFSIGFGPALISVRRASTEYRLSVFPLGGYVLPEAEDPERFFSHDASRRLLFALGGPAANLLLAVLMFSFFNALSGLLSWQGLVDLPLAQLEAALKAALRAVPLAASGQGEISGILGVVAEGSDFVGTDVVAAMQFAIVMSVNLAVLNLLPLPPLDGGKALLCLAEICGGRAARLHLSANVAGLFLLLALLGYAMVLDLSRLLASAFV